MLMQFIFVVILSILFTMLIRWIFRHCEDSVYAKHNKVNLKDAYDHMRNNTKNSKSANIFSYSWGLFSDFFFALSAILFIWPGALFSYLYNNYIPTASALISFSLIAYSIVELYRTFCEFKGIIPLKFQRTDLKSLKCWIYFFPMLIIFCLYIISILIWVFHI